MSKTVIRLVFPQWQGGINPNYAFGSRMLAWVAPEGKNAETVEIPVNTDFDKKLELQDGYYAKDILIRQQKEAAKILDDKKPDRIIILGGDCSVSQAPFDYLHGRYPEDTGVLWVDAHPDISTPKDFSDEHAMVLGNLLGEGAPAMADLVRHPFKRNQVMYVGLVAEDQLDYEKERIKEKPIQYVVPEKLKANSKLVTDWIKENNIHHLVIHWDLDVLTPEGFSSLLCAEPPRQPVDYAVGKLNLEDVIRILNDVSKEAEIEGLTVAEYMPWDAINLRNALSELEIFNC